MREKLVPILLIVVVIAVALLLIASFILPGLSHDGSIVVPGSSMSHSRDENLDGIIDKGDIIYYNSVESRSELVSYIEGEATGYSAYGDYGDVAVFRSDITEIPIIHRLLVWIEINTTLTNGIDDYDNYTGDIE